MEYPFRNLVFEGGGVKGVAYVGALEELDKRGIVKSIKRVGGTSAGAINALLLSLGFNLDETRQILSDLNFNNFMDDTWGVVRDTNRLIERFGWYKGDFFKRWVGDLIREKTRNEYSTFNEFKAKGFRDLYVIGTNLSTGFAEVFSYEHTPRMRVADAVRISMSIPLFFTAVRNMREDLYVDGGVLDNYPIKVFDREKYIQKSKLKKHARIPKYYREENEKLASIQPKSSKYVYNKETLGFRLDSEREIAVFRDGAEKPREKVDDLFDYAWALIKTILNAQNNQHLHSDDWHRTVYINTLGVGTTDFDLTDETKERLVESGEKGTTGYLDWYDRNDPKDPPMNHLDFKDEN